ncbi:MAG: hypothetical protein AB7O66_09505, partial [Limisphaerales bacterium]
MNASLTVPLGSRHPSAYAPLLLPIVPLIAGVLATDAIDRLHHLLGALALGILGILLSIGLGAWIDGASRLVRKE